jgi:hypothetical protein
MTYDILEYSEYNIDKPLFMSALNSELQVQVPGTGGHRVLVTVLSYTKSVYFSRALIDTREKYTLFGGYVGVDILFLYTFYVDLISPLVLFT